MKIKQNQSGEGRPLWEGHRERLRRRMEREGWDALKPYEMVELALYHAVPRQDLSDVARMLVDAFGTVGGVFAASRAQLEAVPGMTPALAEWITLTGDLIYAYRELHGWDDIRLSCYQEVLAFLTPRLSEIGEADLWALYADFNFNLITYSPLGDGFDWWSAANIRRMMEEAIGNGARYVYMVLRRERPDEGMSEVEFERLNAIATALRGADLDLVDCLLAGGETLYSMNVHGKMTAIQAESGCRQLHERYGSS